MAWRAKYRITEKKFGVAEGDWGEPKSIFNVTQYNREINDAIETS